MNDVDIYAVVKDGVVINTVLWDGSEGADPYWHPVEGEAVLVPDDVPVSTGWFYDGKTFKEPEPE